MPVQLGLASHGLAICHEKSILLTSDVSGEYGERNSSESAEA